MLTKLRELPMPLKVLYIGVKMLGWHSRDVLESWMLQNE